MSTTPDDLRRRGDELFARQNAGHWRATPVPGDEILAEIPTMPGEVLIISRYFQSPTHRHAKIGFRTYKIGPRGERYKSAALNFPTTILPAIAEGIAKAMEASLDEWPEWADHDHDR